MSHPSVSASAMHACNRQGKILLRHYPSKYQQRHGLLLFTCILTYMVLIT